jgi:hypothetical protein
MTQNSRDAAPDLGIRDEDMPALYRAADSTSLGGHRKVILGTKIRVWSVLVAAAAGVFVGRVGPPDWIALLGIAAFVVAIGVELYLLDRKPEQAWYEGRAAAESAKSLAWRYAVGGAPFGSNVQDVDELFLERLKDILTDLSTGLDVSSGVDQQITGAMRNLRGSTLDRRRDAYRVGRIEEQRDWYQTKASWNRERAERWRLLAIVLEGSGVVAGIVTVTGIVRVDLLGILAAGTASVVAWLQTKQHETLSRAYSIAAQELAGVRSDWEAPRDEEAWAAFVDKAEEAISREHKLWRASRGVKVGW